MLQLGVRRNHGRREHVRSRSGCGGLIAARCSAVDSMCFPSTLTARGTSSSLRFAGSRPRCDLVCSQWGKPATSLRLIPRVECWRLRSLASAGDYRELIRAVKSCTTGLVQRRCQRKRTHHPLCCHLLSWWAGGSERGNVGRREPFLSSTPHALRAGCGTGAVLVILGGTPRHGRGRQRPADIRCGKHAGAFPAGVGGHHGRDWLSLRHSIGSVWA